MKFTSKQMNIIMWVMVVLGGIGLASAIYLFKIYYIDLEVRGLLPSTVCDINSWFSCEVVNQSKYAKLFGVPLSFLGIIWSLGWLGVMWRTIKKRTDSFDIWLYSATGILFIFYLVWAEIQLHALCLYCTIIHVCVLGVFILSWLTLQKPLREYLTVESIVKSFAFKILVLIGIIDLVSLLFF